MSSEIDRRRLVESSKRVAFELLIIIVGVLAALAVDSWKKSKSLRISEAQHLSQILVDAKVNADQLASGIEEESKRTRAFAQIVRVATGRKESSRDSLRSWLEDDPFSYSDPRLRLGSIEALISAGDLRLISDQQLRSEIVGYLGRVKMDLEELNRWLDIYVQVFGALDLQDAEIRLRSPGLQQWERDIKVIEKASEDSEVLSLLLNFSNNAFNRTSYMESMLEATIQLSQSIEDNSNSR